MDAASEDWQITVSPREPSHFSREQCEPLGYLLRGQLFHPALSVFPSCSDYLNGLVREQQIVHCQGPIIHILAIKYAQVVLLPQDYPLWVIKLVFIKKLQIFNLTQICMVDGFKKLSKG